MAAELKAEFSWSTIDELGNSGREHFQGSSYGYAE